jgi:hypothetical protein
MIYKTKADPNKVQIVRLTVEQRKRLLCPGGNRLVYDKPTVTSRMSKRARLFAELLMGDR